MFNRFKAKLAVLQENKSKNFHHNLHFLAALLFTLLAAFQISVIYVLCLINPPLYAESLIFLVKV